MADQKDFATTGTDAFKLAGRDPDKIVLNIQEDQPKAIILNKNQAESTGNVVLDWYKKVNNYFLSKSKVDVKEKSNFFHLLAVMINAGIPMVKSLQSLELQLDKSPRLQMIIRELAADIESGKSLSEAIFDYPNVFSDAEVGMLQSGEASGQLSNVLNNLAEDAEKAYSIKSKVKSAMMYPIIIFMLLIAVVVAMMVWVIPKLTELFAATQGELPLVTRIVVGLSDFMVNNTTTMALMTVAIVLFFIMFRKTDVGRYMIDKFKISMPIFGKLFKKAYLSRFARSLGNLLDSNVSIVKTMEITANSIGNEVYRRRLLLAVEDIKQGIPLAENLTASDLFPPMLVNMIEVGEKTAQLDEITRKVAKFYEDEVDTAVAGISKIIEPIILVIIGLVVGTVVAAVMLPIMQLSNLTETL